MAHKTVSIVTIVHPYPTVSYLLSISNPNEHGASTHLSLLCLSKYYCTTSSKLQLHYVLFQILKKKK